MALMNGVYEWAKSENFTEYLQAHGVTTDESKLNAGTLTVNINGNKGTIGTESSSGTRSANFTFGESFEESFGENVKVQSVASSNGSQITITSTGSDGKEYSRTYEFADRGCKVSMTSAKTDIVGIRYYKRV